MIDTLILAWPAVLMMIATLSALRAEWIARQRVARALSRADDLIDRIACLRAAIAQEDDATQARIEAHRAQLEKLTPQIRDFIKSAREMGQAP